MSFLSNSNSQKSTILITGGASGIGLAIGQRLMALGHTVIAAGRRQDVLDAAAKANPGLKTIQADVATDAGRIDLFNETVKKFPDVNVLFNNAGVIHVFDMPPLKDLSDANWQTHKSALAINLEAPIHLSSLFANHLISKPNGLIMNNSSLVALFPVAAEPVYCATKAGLHSFTISLRHQLKDSSVKVVELLPVNVATDIGPPPEHNPMSLDVYTEDVMRQLLQDVKEIAQPESHAILRGSRDLLDATTDKWNGVV
eukprot:gene37233-45941_t